MSCEVLINILFERLHAAAASAGAGAGAGAASSVFYSLRTEPGVGRLLIAARFAQSRLPAAIARGACGLVARLRIPNRGVGIVAEAV